ncbi:MAG: YaiO family outer membrane beta-barrel protein [Nitrospinae bacterium]|nr:YaiO family outer membrane beta-barrel protein [Nitrospinota bacterium]
MRLLFSFTAAVFVLTANTSHAEALYDQALKAADRKDYVSSEILIKKWLENNPGDEIGVFFLARVLSWSGKTGEALGQYDSLLAKSPMNTDYLMGKANTLLWAGRGSEALPLADTAIGISPSYEDLWRLKITILSGMGEDFRDKAIAVQREAMRRFPQSVWDIAPIPSHQPRAVVLALGNVPQIPDGRGAEMETGYSHERLTNGFVDWKSVYLEGARYFSGQSAVYMSAQSAERFSLRDSEALAGFYYPAFEAVTFNAEATGSPTYNFLPRWSTLLKAQWEVADGKLIHLGGRHTEYAQSSVDLYLATAEAYFGNYRASYTFYQSHPQGAGVESSHLLEVNLFYGNNAENSIGLSVSGGREAESLGGGRVAVSDVQSITLTGRHWLDESFGITYALIHHKQGELYVNDGIRIGIRLRLQS